MAREVKNPLANAGAVVDTGSNPWFGKIQPLQYSYQEMVWQPLQYSYQGNLIDRGGWWTIIHGVAESDRPEAT